jgi:hypothetical protein
MFYEDWGTVYCLSPVASPLTLYRNKKKKRDTRVGVFFELRVTGAITLNWESGIYILYYGMYLVPAQI